MKSFQMAILSMSKRNINTSDEGKVNRNHPFKSTDSIDKVEIIRN